MSVMVYKKNYFIFTQSKGKVKTDSVFEQSCVTVSLYESVHTFVKGEIYSIYTFCVKKVTNPKSILMITVWAVKTMTDACQMPEDIKN